MSELDSTRFLTIDLLLRLHRRVTEEFGGDQGIRDRGLLESAAAMPQAQFGGQFLHPSLPAMAAAYLFHLCKNHPFIDGNKRAALAAAEVFLILNGRTLDATDDELYELTIGVAEGRISKDEATLFFEQRGTTADATR